MAAVGPQSEASGSKSLIQKVTGADFETRLPQAGKSNVEMASVHNRSSSYSELMPVFPLPNPSWKPFHT